MSVAQSVPSFHFAMIPKHVSRARVSERAKGLWREMALLASPHKPTVWVRQENFAEILGCSVSTIQRALNELLDAGLIAFTKAWHQGRHKIYKLFFTEEKTSSDATSVKNDVPRTSNLTEDVQQICSNINKAIDHNNEHNNAEKTQNEVCKEKTEKVVVVDDKEKVEIKDKNTTVAMLRDKGIAKDQAHKLVATHGDDACMKQVEHLEILQQQNKPIKNPIAWLVAAISQCFAPPEPVKMEQAPQMSAFEKKHRELLRKAKVEMHFKDYPRAIAYAREGLAIGDRPVFHRIIAHAQEKMRATA